MNSIFLLTWTLFLALGAGVAGLSLVYVLQTTGLFQVWEQIYAYRCVIFGEEGVKEKERRKDRSEVSVA